MKGLRSLASALLLGLAGPLSAATVTLQGSSFDVSYDDSALGLFGAPVLVGDVISWFPTEFKVSTTSDIAFANSTFALLVTAHPGSMLTSFSLTESGDYRYFGPGNEVDVAGQLVVTSLRPAAPPVFDSIEVSSGPFVPQPARFGSPTQSWMAQASVQPVPGTTFANATLQNLLGAFAADAIAGDYAFVEKKNVALSIGVTSPIPELNTSWMLLAGLAAVGFVVSRRSGGRF